MPAGVAGASRANRSTDREPRQVQRLLRARGFRSLPFDMAALRLAQGQAVECAAGATPHYRRRGRNRRGRRTTPQDERGTGARHLRLHRASGLRSRHRMNLVRALLFDVGNTRLKWGLLAQGRVGKSGSIAHEKLHDSGFGALTSNLPRDIDTVLVSNVAGQTFATRLSGVIGMHCNCDVHFARAEREGYGLTNSYRRPRRIGVDRWVAMIGAYAEFRSALCVVDAGTAVTIDAVDRDGVHL